MPAIHHACLETEPGLCEVIGIFHNKAKLVSGSADYADKGKYTDRFSVAVPADGQSFRMLLGAVRYGSNFS